MFYREKDFLQKFIKLIRICNSTIFDIYNKDFDTTYKNDNSPLTTADKESNKLIVNFIKEHFPQMVVISEEIKNDSYDKRKNNEWCWLIDPLDGTKEFVKKNGQFTINIGLCHNNVPVFGIVSIPCTGEIYYGIEGIGSFKLSAYIEERLSIPKKKFNQEGLRIISSLSHCNRETEEYISKFKSPKLLSVGSSIKLLYIAENKADIYPRIAPTSEWDTCAAHAVVKYAGGKVLQYNSNNELVYNKENLLNPYFVVF